ncbi:MAG: L,D-transpeptidase family protein [Deltaproteobacteria bacterium]|nr:L,D-transpeptidase family protein [Deltaproteobacteria bacterium]
MNPVRLSAALIFVDPHPWKRPPLSCVALLCFLLLLCNASPGPAQTLAVLKEVTPGAVEASAPVQEGIEARAASPYWRPFIWEALPPNSLIDSNGSQILEAYQLNEWRPFFFGARFELNAKGKTLLERLQKLQDDAIDPAPFALDSFQAELLKLESLRQALMVLDPAFRDTLAVLEDWESPQTGSGGKGPDGGNIRLASANSQIPLPEKAFARDREEHYRQLFRTASLLDTRLAEKLVRFTASMHPRYRDEQVKVLSDQMDMADFLRGLELASPQYENLKKAARMYSALVSGDVKQPVIAGVRLQLGDRGDAVAALQKRLHQEGFYDGKITGVFDVSTQDAVKKFQRAHLVDDDGTIGKQTQQWLNVSYRFKLGMIRDAMRNLRLSEARFHDRYIRINIPQFTLEYYKEGRVHAVHRVIVGKASGKKIKLQGRLVGENHTPPLTSAIEQLVINPRWYVSDRIRQELNGQAGDDPTYFVRNGYVQMSSQHPWGEHRLYMLPGPSNPLGRVKFDFPNPYAVYLHDTPKKYLFQRSRRDFSHGCIRVERAQELAQLLLTDDGNPAAQKTQTYYATNRQVFIRLEQPVPIIIEYQPVSFGSDNEVVFCGDPYGWFGEKPSLG